MSAVSLGTKIRHLGIGSVAIAGTLAFAYTLKEYTAFDQGEFDRMYGKDTSKLSPTSPENPIYHQELFETVLRLTVESDRPAWQVNQIPSSVIRGKTDERIAAKKLLKENETAT